MLCYDHSRVCLSQVDGDATSDYINANFVDGYKQKNAFISTQGPLPKTCGDFWRMVWEQQTLVIVMTTRYIVLLVHFQYNNELEISHKYKVLTIYILLYRGFDVKCFTNMQIDFIKLN